MKHGVRRIWTVSVLKWRRTRYTGEVEVECFCGTRFKGDADHSYRLLLQHAEEWQDVCCDDLHYHLQANCSVHPDPYDCPDVVVVRTDDGFGLPIHDGGSSYIEIWHCPWCGAKIPKET